MLVNLARGVTETGSALEALAAKILHATAPSAVDRVRDKLSPDELAMLVEILRRRLEPNGLVGNDARDVVKKTLEIIDAPVTTPTIKAKIEDAPNYSPHPPGKRCDRCHHTAPNPEGCARCNPVRLGERLTLALGELELLKRVQRFYVLVRVRVWHHEGSERSTGQLGYQPLWWTIDDHDGSNFAISHNERTIVVASLVAKNLQDAREQFAASYALFAPILDGISSLDPASWAGKLDAEQHDEAMAGFYMARLDARRSGKLDPPTPRLDFRLQALKTGDRVQLGLRLNARVTIASDAHGSCIEVEPERDLAGLGQKEPKPRPRFWIDANEVVGLIALGRRCGASFEQHVVKRVAAHGLGVKEHGATASTHYCNLHLGHLGPHAV